ncbi:MAG: TonB-dependent receptor plug domain-containing protein, partial [Myxococcota bacterium]
MAEPAPEPAAAPEAAPAPAPAAAPAKKTEGVEEIVVTGTRIGRSNLQEYGHITVVSSEQLASSGVTTIDELLLDLPSVTLQGINKNQNNGGEGLAFIDLRNLGSNRTLVLVNGRRFVASGTGVGEAVDLNNIPVQLIDRVEVLLDGASAIYGSDAIGGVVNIILKNNFEGMQLDAHGGISSYGDGEEMSLAATMGSNFDRGNLVFNLSYVNRQQIAQKDREWAKYPIVDAEVDPTTGQIINYYNSSYVVEGRVGGTWFRPDGAGASFQDFAYGPKDVGYNYGEAQWLIGKQERFALTTLGTFDISKDIKAYMEGTFTHRHSRQRLASQPLGGANTTYPG